MTHQDPFSPTIAWRRGVNHPEREPLEIDVQDGCAEHILSGPYRMAEGAKIEVIDGKVLWTGGRPRPN